MKHTAPTELVKCISCGKEFDKQTAYEMLTGRTKYICPQCHEQGQREINAKHEDWRASSKGKATIEHFKKNK